MAAQKRQKRLKRCKCGELELAGIETGSQFGWFTTEEGTFCQRCGRKQR